VTPPAVTSAHRAAARKSRTPFAPPGDIV